MATWEIATEEAPLHGIQPRVVRDLFGVAAGAGHGCGSSPTSASPGRRSFPCRERRDVVPLAPDAGRIATPSAAQADTPGHQLIKPLNGRGRDVSSEDRPDRCPPDGCAAIRIGRSWLNPTSGSENPSSEHAQTLARPPTIDPHRLRRLQPVLHASGVMQGRPASVINECQAGTGTEAERDVARNYYGRQLRDMKGLGRGRVEDAARPRPLRPHLPVEAGPGHTPGQGTRSRSPPTWVRTTSSTGRSSTSPSATPTRTSRTIRRSRRRSDQDDCTRSNASDGLVALVQLSGGPRPSRPGDARSGHPPHPLPVHDGLGIGHPGTITGYPDPQGGRLHCSARGCPAPAPRRRPRPGSGSRRRRPPPRVP